MEHDEKYYATNYIRGLDFEEGYDEEFLTGWFTNISMNIYAEYITRYANEDDDPITYIKNTLEAGVKMFDDWRNHKDNFYCHIDEMAFALLQLVLVAKEKFDNMENM